MSFASERENLHDGPEPADDPHALARPADLWVGLRIRMRRFELGMSQQALADAMGISQVAQIRKWEKGRHRLVVSRVWDIARALKVSPTYFWEGYHPGDAPDWPIELSEVTGILTRENVQAIIDMNQLTQSQRDTVAQMIAAFARGNAIDRAHQP